MDGQVGAQQGDQQGAHQNGMRIPAAPQAWLKSVAAVFLPPGVRLALAVAHSQGPYAFEDRIINSLGPPSAVQAWIDLITYITIPAIALALAVSVIVGLLRRALRRVVAYAALAGVIFLLIEYVAKPLVHRSDGGFLTFPSGHVTAVCATALAMCLALFPLLGEWARHITLALGVGWVLLISLAVVGGLWDTPVDVVGSILLSIGIVAAGGLVIESIVPVHPSKPRMTRAHTLHAPFGRTP